MKRRFLRPLTKPGTDSGSDYGSDRISDRIGLRIGSDRIGLVFSLLVQNYYFWEKAVLTMTQVDRIFFFPAACVSNKKNCFSCITSLKIHHQLENHHKELFSSKLHWEIFCCINSCDYNSTTRLGHVTPPKSKTAEKGSNWFKRKEKGGGGERFNFVSFHLYSLPHWSSFSLSLN